MGKEKKNSKPKNQKIDWSPAEQLRLGDAAATFIPRELTANGFALLSITLAHVTQVEILPFHHRDPFDRLIVAQCLSESLDLVSRDGGFDAYIVRRHW